jgi:signal peptidase I
MTVHRSTRRLLTGVLVAPAVLAVLVAGAVATGRIAAVGIHGVSMNPLYYQGDLVIVAKADSYHVGQIVAYRVPSKHIVVLHRIIGEADGGFVMKGDNNQSIDPTRPTAKLIVGRAVLHIPHGNLWLTRLTSPDMLALIAFALTAAGGGTATIQTRRRRKRAAMSQHAKRGNHVTPSAFALPPHLKTAAAVTAATAVIGLALAALAWYAQPTKASKTFTQTTRKMTFSYTAAVARTPAYDNTTVQSPDPVFRQLTNSVDLHLAYQGNANQGGGDQGSTNQSSTGSVSVSAELSTPSGWHSSIPLAALTSFTGAKYQSTVRLDLTTLDARAQAAATVTGLPAAPLTLAIVPTVQTGGDAPWTPALHLTLTPLQLTLAGDPTSMVVQSSATVSHPAHIANTLGMLGRHITVAQTRIITTILLLAGLLSGLVLTIIAWRTAPASEGAAIRHRYGSLLASVEPITTRPNLPVIEVTEFDTLAKLAERCGLLVLHWSRTDVDTFIVLDEGTTYRYRTAVGAWAKPPAKASECSRGTEGRASAPSTDSDETSELDMT